MGMEISFCSFVTDKAVVLENHSIYKDRLQYHSKNYVRAYLESWWTILWKERINKDHLKEHQYNNLSHCIMQIKSYKKLTKNGKWTVLEKRKIVRVLKLTIPY